MSNNLIEHSFEVLNNIKINDRIDKSIIKSTFESSDERNKNLDIMSIKTPFELLSKQVLTFLGLGRHNSKRETQNERLGQCACLDCRRHA